MLAGRFGNFARYEIEKKYRLKEPPPDLPEQYIDIVDTYLPQSSLRLRIEKSAAGEVIGRKLTKKEKVPELGSTTNLMTSLYLSERDLHALGDIRGPQLHKRRHISESENHRIVYDFFKGALEGLILVEVEFSDHRFLETYVVPDSKWEEVTGNSKYTGGNLAEHGLPDTI